MTFPKAWTYLVRSYRLARAVRALQKAQHQFRKLDDPALAVMTATLAKRAVERIR